MRLLLLIVMLILNPFSSLFSEEEVNIIRKDTAKLEYLKFYLLKDILPSEKIEDVLKKEPVLNTRYNQNENPRNYQSKETFTWFRLQIKNESDKNEFFWDFQTGNFSRVEVYEVENGTITGQFISGKLIKIAERSYPDRVIVFNLKIPSQITKTYYVKIYSEISIFLPWTLYDEGEYFIHSKNRDTGFGILYGALIVMFVFNLLVWIYLKSYSYFFYCLSIFSTILYQASLTGHGLEYIWIDSIDFNYRANLFFAFGAYAFGIAFTNAFLKLHKISKLLHYLSLGGIVFNLLMMIVCYFFPFRVMNSIAAYQLWPVSFFAIFSGWYSYLCGFKPARFYILAWSIYLALLIGMTAVFMGKTELNLGFVRYKLNWQIFEILYFYSYRIGAVLENVLLAFALADRINFYKFKVQQSNIELERIIENRTKELRQNLNLLKKDLLLAKKIQETILNYSIQSSGNIKVDATYIPLEEVGGDIYDVSMINEKVLRIMLADATGHGVQAALITMIIKNEYENLKMDSVAPSDLLTKINHTFYEKYNRLRTFFTCIIVDINLEENSISYASAGHPDQLLVHENEIYVLPHTGKMLGLMKDLYFNEGKYPFNLSDRLLLFTDGILEEFNKDHIEFGETGLLKSVKNSAKQKNSSFSKMIIYDLDLFLKQSKRQDDITILEVYIAK